VTGPGGRSGQQSLGRPPQGGVPGDRRAGVVLREALPVGTWRGSSEGKAYEVTVVPFHELAEAAWEQLEGEAERVVHVRGRRAATVVRVPVP
jgi:hypothetical protein